MLLKKLEHQGTDTFDLAAKKDFIALKAEVGKLNMNKVNNVPTILNNLKAKVNDLDVGKLKTVPVSDVVDNEVVKNTKFNILKTNISNLEKKITSIQQINTIWRC